jgi:hypothetical protein
VSIGWRVESPLQKVDVCSDSTASFRPSKRRLQVTATVFGCGAWEWQNKLRMIARCAVDAVVGFEWNDCAQGKRIRSMSKTPDIFQLFIRQARYLFKVQVRRQRLNAGSPTGYGRARGLGSVRGSGSLGL